MFLEIKMNCDKKLLEQKRKTGLVKCPICKKMGRPDWNIYSANSLCSESCKQKMIDKLCKEASRQIYKNTNY